MDKPTIFFSHSSKDKDAILSIKNKLDTATGGVLDIFMSSDGQSIPFGTNWIHKIEEGLQAAKIMFVFVTDASVASGWIYFEAGFAYSKGIQVVPVGIGIDIGTLKAPLNLLQGFNITSEDSLNNFITIINRTFEYHFKEIFDKNDYADVMSSSVQNDNKNVRFERIVSQLECEIDSKEMIDGETKEYNLEAFFNNIVTYLEDNSIKYSRENNYGGSRLVTCVMVYGLKIIYRIAPKNMPSSPNRNNNTDKIRFQISPYNFPKSFALFQQLFSLFKEKKHNYLRVHLQKAYDYMTVEEDGASIISCSEGFHFDKSYIGGYICDDLNLRFYIFEEPSEIRGCAPTPLMSVVYECDNVCSARITDLIYRLCNIGLICEQ